MINHKHFNDYFLIFNSQINLAKIYLYFLRKQDYLRGFKNFILILPEIT